MNTHICDGCQQTFKHEANLYRHKNHSCKSNINRTRRSDQQPKKPKSPVKWHTNNIPLNLNTDDCQGNPNHANDFQLAIPTTDTEMDSCCEEQESNESMKETIKDTTHPLLSMKEEILSIMKDFDGRMRNMDDNFKKYMDTSPKTGTTVYKPTNVFNIEKIQIYMTDSIDFIEVLTKRFGNRKQAVDYIRSKIHKKVEGDVDVFCEIYLHGEPDTWPISCPDKKNHVFRIAQPNAEVINDPGGVQIYKMFKNIYSNTLLRLNNSAIYDTLNKLPGTPEYEESRDNLLDSFELGLIQAKAHELCKAPCDPFVKKLAVKFKSLEKSYELDCVELHPVA